MGTLLFLPSVSRRASWLWFLCICLLVGWLAEHWLLLMMALLPRQVDRGKCLCPNVNGFISARSTPIKYKITKSTSKKCTVEASQRKTFFVCVRQPNICPCVFFRVFSWKLKPFLTAALFTFTQNPKIFQDFPSHQIFRHMNKVLNININKN